LAEFDDEQIEQFIRRWFRSDLEQEAGTATNTGNSCKKMKTSHERTGSDATAVDLSLFGL
jgi:predicted NACHT family NTPase